MVASSNNAFLMFLEERIYYYQRSKSSLPMTNMKRAKTTTSCSIEKVDFSSNSEHDDAQITAMKMIVLNRHYQLAL